jgi:hypothetical protein
MPSVGLVECMATPGPGDGQPGQVQCSTNHHHLLTIPIFGEHLSLAWLADSPFGAPAVVAVGVSPGGSDTRYETAAIVGGAEGLVDVWPRHWQTLNADVICFGFYREGAAGVLGLTFAWGRDEGETHYAPHRYRATKYRWDGAALAYIGEEQTKARVANWQEAAAELGLMCPHPYGDAAGLDRFK